MGTAQKENTKKWPAIFLILMFMLPMGGGIYMIFPLPENIPQQCRYIEGEIVEMEINEGWCLNGVCVQNYELEVAEGGDVNNTTTVIIPPLQYLQTNVGDTYAGPVC